MRVNDLIQGEKYLLLDAGEIWDLEISSIGDVAIYLKPVETDFQIGAKQYIDGLLKMKIQKFTEEVIEKENQNKDVRYLEGKLDFAKDLYNSLEWRDENGY